MKSDIIWEMDVFREMQIQSYALVFGSLRVASKVPKVRFGEFQFWVMYELCQWLTGKTVEKMIRESPPQCLSDPQLGRHLFVKINVS